MWLFNTEPNAYFTATPGEGAVPLDVFFTAVGSSDPDDDELSFSWDFDDGHTSTAETIQHRFDQAGTYHVRLTVDDGWGGISETSVDISVSQRTRTYYALIIGIADYYESPLEYTDNDAVDFTYELLKSPSMWNPENMILLLNSAATQANFIAGLSAISAVATADDVLLIFYSGHGGRWSDGWPLDEADGWDETLCFIDGDITDDYFASLLRGVPVGEFLVFVDACLSGGQLRGQSAGELAPRSIGFGFVEDLVTESAAGMKDLNDLNRPLVAIASSADDESSIEWSSLEHGVFTYYLLEAMKGQADFYGNGDGLISAEECYEYLAPYVVAFTTTVGAPHVPQLLDYKLGELVFAED